MKYSTQYPLFYFSNRNTNHVTKFLAILIAIEFNSFDKIFSLNSLFNIDKTATHWYWLDIFSEGKLLTSIRPRFFLYLHNTGLLFIDNYFLKPNSLAGKGGSSYYYYIYYIYYIYAWSGAPFKKTHSTFLALWIFRFYLCNK